MNVGRWAIVIIGCLLFFGIGFKAGEYVEAGGLMPGSSGDPLAAKSYVDKAVTEKLVQLQSQAEDLDAKVVALQQTVNKLEGKIGTTATVQDNAPVVNTEPEPVQETQPQTPQPVQPDVKPTGKNAKIITSSANVRKGPGTNYEIVAGLLLGTSVPVLKIEDKWIYVDLGNTKGWINQNLVEIK